MSESEWLSIEEYHTHINGVLSAWLIGQMARRGELRSVKIGARLPSARVRLSMRPVGGRAMLSSPWSRTRTRSLQAKGKRGTG
jgi:hypothetical protein